jgi:DNA-binding NtrC family response regulator
LAGKELEFIFRSLIELKLQVEELRRRLEDTAAAQRVEVIEVGPGAAAARATPSLGIGQIEQVDERDAGEPAVIYRSGMSMADVERAAIQAALRETAGNRRRAAEILGIGERTLYRKLKQYALV